MTQRASNFARVLMELKISEEIVQNTKKLIMANRELRKALANPAVKKIEKNKIIDVIFDEKIRSYLKVLCDYDYIDSIEQIFKAYEAMELERKNIIGATFIYVIRPEDIQLEKIKNFICRKYNMAGVLLELKEDSSLLGGFLLIVGDTVYDKSIKGNLSGLYKTLVWR